MSIRTNPMKAVPTLLKRLSTIEGQANLDDLKSELMNIKDVFLLVKQNKEELLDTLAAVDGYLRNSNMRKLMEEKEDICRRLRTSFQKLLPADAAAVPSGDTEAVHSSSIKPFQYGRKRKEVMNRVHSFSQLQDIEKFKVHSHNLDHLHKKRGLLSLLLFPEKTVIKKRDIITWWMGLGDILGEGDGEDVFVELLHCNLIVPHHQGNCPHVNKFQVNPWVRKNSMPLLQKDKKQLFGIYSQIKTSSSHHNDTLYGSLTLDRREVKLCDEFGFKSNHWKAVFNVNASYLKFGLQWMAKMKYLEVLHLGRWPQHSASHHIEVENEEFLKELEDQKCLKYLSLRGISRISELPPSIFQLESLETLDLKACHNLETLPNDIASLRNLRRLDLSQCYLLDRMPKGIEKLTELRVLKGFVIGSSSKNPSTISDLANLKKLEQLSIHIGSGAVIQDGEFESLKELSALEHLKISWGVSDIRYSDMQIILPSNLEKLHLEGFPGENIPEWLKPDKLPFLLKELNITGGKLKSMDHGEIYDKDRYPWLKIIRLKYLKHLNVHLTNLREMFPSLWYVDIKHVPNSPSWEGSIE
ncbi:hypothetical protein JHK87_002874 [Glycine soja]|nr:hypothetical protein JHK87_002874 [Glycine soja]